MNKIESIIEGRLTPIKFLYKIGNKRYMWLCKCSCGNESVVEKWQINKGTKSCGCLRSRCGFQKGHKTNIGRKHTEKTKKKMSLNSWIKKGENAGYSAKHMWILKNYGKANKCEMCGTKTAKRYEWANLNHKYRKDIKDWKQLCKKCHFKYDSEHNSIFGRKKINSTL